MGTPLVSADSLCTATVLPSPRSELTKPLRAADLDSSCADPVLTTSSERPEADILSSTCDYPFRSI